MKLPFAIVQGVDLPVDVPLDLPGISSHSRNLYEIAQGISSHNRNL